MPSAAIESVKMSVAALSSAGRSIGIVMLKSTRTGRAPALRAASSSDESARDSAAWQVRKAIGKSRVASTSAIPGIVSIAIVGRWNRS
jgi:hypothetical protein